MANSRAHKDEMRNSDSADSAIDPSIGEEIQKAEDKQAETPLGKLKAWLGMESPTDRKMKAAAKKKEY